LHQATLVLTVSNFAAGEIADVHGISPGRIRVATEAPSATYRPSACVADIASVARKYGVRDGERWFVYVGGFNPHKHVDVIVRAHAAAVRGIEHPPRLLLVGTRDSDVFHGAGACITDAIRECGTTELVTWTGFVPDEELCHLLSGAIALLLPSESEGFGLPAVEAAACGTPVIATTASPLPELLEDGGYFVKPGDATALTRAMIALLTDESDRLARGAHARERAGRLSWTATADATLSALREAAA
jgi:alpha-1,3-rhamnosyl/mannosyltransferase